MITHRNDLGILFQEKNKKGVGAEIGVEYGWYSNTIFQYWRGNVLLVDPYMYQEDWKCSFNVSDEEQLKKMEAAKILLRPYGDRANFCKETSLEASKTISRCFLDWVYIDARHDYESVKQDLELWYPKVRRGGVFSGHDYLDGTIVNDIFGVKSAVDEFCKKKKLKFEVTTEEYPSWYLIKP